MLNANKLHLQIIAFGDRPNYLTVSNLIGASS